MSKSNEVSANNNQLNQAVDEVSKEIADVYVKYFGLDLANKPIKYLILNIS